MTSIVVDTCVMRLYDNPFDPRLKDFFSWVLESGSLCISQKLLNEYIGTGNKNITILLAELQKKEGRIFKVTNSDINNFSLDKKYNYTCNYEDTLHAKLVFLSPRKKMVSQDHKIIKDINGFKKVDKIKPQAVLSPPGKSFYE